MDNATPNSIGMTGSGPDRSARLAGACLLLTAATTVLMVFTRVAADADQDTLLESLLAVDENRALYGISGVARLLSGVALLAGGWFLVSTWIIRGRWASPLVPYLFAFSALFTIISGACTILIAAYPAPETSLVAGEVSGDVSRPVEIVSQVRWIAAKVGFTLAGLAVIVAARFQWQVGGTLKWIAPSSLVIGLAMQFIWVDSATIMHPIIGTAFFLWLVAVGTMLITGKVELHFAAKYIQSGDASQESP